jgi:hypothetical protein
LALVVPTYDLIATRPLELLAILVIGGCLGVVGSGAGFTIVFGMLAYLFRYDQSSLKSKIMWRWSFSLRHSSDPVCISLRAAESRQEENK